jgi:hypothetical protein
MALLWIIWLKIEIGQCLMKVSLIKFWDSLLKVYGIQRKVHLWSCVNQDLLWIIMAANKNCITSFSGGLLYQILTRFVKWFIGNMESPFIVSCRPGIIMKQYGWILEFPYDFWLGSTLSVLNSVCEIVCGISWNVHLWLHVNHGQTWLPHKAFAFSFLLL